MAIFFWKRLQRGIIINTWFADLNRIANFYNDNRIVTTDKKVEMMSTLPSISLVIIIVLHFELCMVKVILFIENF